MLRNPLAVIALGFSTGALAVTACRDRPAPQPLTVAATLTQARASDGRFISWKEHRIDDEELAGVPIRGGDGLKMVDLDADGYEDIVSVHEADVVYGRDTEGFVRIAFGSSDPDRWELVTLSEGKEAAAAEDVAIGDLNGDGFPDILIACELAHLLYLQNPGPESRNPSAWKRVIPDVTRNRGSYIRVFSADLNGDGRLEVVAANKGQQEPTLKTATLHPISWFEIPADPLEGGQWLEHELTRVLTPINSRPVDLDADGDLDILGGSRHEGRIFWFENVSEGEISFVEHPIEVTGRSAPWKPAAMHLTGMSFGFLDVNEDGRVDLVTQETPSRIVWLEQPESHSRPWKIHRIGAIYPDQGVGITLWDLDGDGDQDLLLGSYSEGPRDHDDPSQKPNQPAGRISWFQNPGRADSPWIRHDIVRRKRGMYDQMVVRDFDGDGDPDFAATRGNSGIYDGVFWMEQVRTESPVRSFQPDRLEDSQDLPLPPPPPADEDEMHTPGPAA